MGVRRGGARLSVVAAGIAAMGLVGTSAAWGCGGLVAPNGAVDLERATTLAAYADGVEHYVTAFEFSDVNSDFGAIVPLPGVPTSVKKAGNWTLQRLVREVTPPVPAPLGAALSAGSASEDKATVLLQTQVDALDITVLSGGGPSVVKWVRAHGYRVSDDAPAMLDFYAKRSPVFLAAKFDPAEAIRRGIRAGDSTPIQIAIPTPNPWVPLRILGMAMEDDESVDADIFLLTPRRPALLSGRGMTLKRSEKASPLLLNDLANDKRMGWMPRSHMWFSYLQLKTPPGELTYDLAIDTTGDNHPSTTAAAMPDALTAGPLLDLPNPDDGAPAMWLGIGAATAIIGCALFVAVRSARPAAA